MEILRSRHKIDRELTTFADRFNQNQNAVIASVTSASAKSTATQASTPATIWHQVMRYLARYAKAIRRGISDEMQTAMYGRIGMQSTYDTIGVGSGNETWLDLQMAYYQPGASVQYPVYNSHMQASTRGAWTEWIAPEDGDYHVEMFVDMSSSDSAGNDYVGSVISTASPGGTWQTPLLVAAGTNLAMDFTTRLVTNGSIMLRLMRGTRVRFGLTQLRGITGAKATQLEVRVAVHKAKFYPPIIQP